jgi:hypothetical protein
VSEADGFQMGGTAPDALLASEEQKRAFLRGARSSAAAPVQTPTAGIIWKSSPVPKNWQGKSLH